MNFVVGAFAFRQTLDSDPSFKQEQGAAAARFLLAPSAIAATPGLLDGYGFNQYLEFRNVSAALFGQLEWSVTDRLRLLPGLRFNYDQKDVDFDQQVYGGLQTTDPALIALQRSILAPQAYKADVDDTNLSGQMTVAYKVASERQRLCDLCDQLQVGRPQPERRAHRRVGPARPRRRDGQARGRAPHRGRAEDRAASAASRRTSPSIDTDIKDFQAQVVNAGVGVLRGYLANAEKVRVRGVEFDGSARVNSHLSFYGAAAYTDGKYVSFPDAPPPLEDTGGPQVKDISGSDLPGISKWALSFGGEYVHPATVLGRTGEFFGALDASYRSSFSSSASASRYLVVDGYSLLNARVGFRWADGWTLSLWSRNLLDKDYFELLSAAPGNSGLYVGQPGDPRTVGVTLRMTFR